MLVGDPKTAIGHLQRWQALNNDENRGKYVPSYSLERAAFCCRKLAQRELGSQREVDAFLLKLLPNEGRRRLFMHHRAAFRPDIRDREAWDLCSNT